MYCKKHNQHYNDLHSRTVICTECFAEACKTHMNPEFKEPTVVDLQKQVVKLKEDNQILSSEVSRLYNLLDFLAYTLQKKCGIDSIWNSYTGRLQKKYIDTTKKIQNEI